jgi:hypothetical protein
MIERAIWWVATKPWIMSATGYTRAYRVAMDFDDMEAILRWFNDIGEIIDRYYGKPVFGLHLEWAFVDRDGKSAKCLRLRQRGGLGSGILHYLAASNKTLMREPPLPLSDEERALRAKVRHKISRAVAQHKIGHGVGNRLPETPVGFLIPGYKKLNYRPDAPPQDGPESYGPEDWQLMLDFLFTGFVPDWYIDGEAKRYDGWWNRKGRKKVAFQNIRSGIAPFS